MFSRIYDLLMADVDYSQVYDFVKPYLSDNATILDAGCGSGYLLLELLNNGHDALGLDYDSSMLSLANDKIRSKQFNPILYEHDLRMPLGIKVDVILAMFDVVNYFKGIKAVFKNIYQALNEKGVFILDLYQEVVLKQYDNYLEVEEEPIAYEWRTRTNKQIMSHWVKLKNETQTIKQYVYELDYYLKTLTDLGFRVEIKKGPDIRKHYLVAFK